MKRFSRTNKIASATLVASLLASPMFALAAVTDYINDTLSTLKINTAGDHTILFTTPTGVLTNSETFTVTFESDFDLTAIDDTDIDIATSTSACDATPTFADVTVSSAAGASTWGASASGQILTVTAPTDAATILAATADTCIQIQIGQNATGGGANAQITNPSSAADYTIAWSGTDTGTTTVTILNDDQVQLTAEVAQSITFSISSNSASFGTLGSGGARYATSTSGSASEVIAHNLIAGTNASAGYVITVEGDTLTSGANTITAITGAAASSTAGTEQFGVRYALSGSGSGSVTADYGYSSSYYYGASAGSADTIASASGSTATNTYDAYYVANIAANTEAGTYTAALTYVATANY